MEQGKRAVGLKNFTIGEPFFPGHFPGNPIVPGVLIVEALAQVGAVAILSVPENRNKVVYFAAIDGFRFRQPVTPGDSIRLDVAIAHLRGKVGKGVAKATLGETIVAEGQLTFVMVEPST